MSKFIKDSTYNALVAARDNWNTVAAHVANSGDGGEGLTAETVTPQMVIDALEAESDTAQNAELQAALDRIRVLESEKTSLTEQVGFCCHTSRTTILVVFCDRTGNFNHGD